MLTASASTNDSLFVPELLAITYNDSISPIFTALSLDASKVSAIEDYAKVSYYRQEGNATIYANKDQTIFFFFGSTDRYSTASNVMFYTSLEDQNPVKNLPQQAFAFAVCSLDPSCEFASFGLWINDAMDGDTYDATSFDAVYQLEPSDHSSIILVR